MSEIFLSSSHGSLLLICRRKLWVCVSVCLSSVRNVPGPADKIEVRWEKGSVSRKLQHLSLSRIKHKTIPGVITRPVDAVKSIGILATHMLPSMSTNCYPDTFPVGVKRSPSFLIPFLPLWPCRVFPAYITVY
jgi:hypothetical protein